MQIESVFPTAMINAFPPPMNMAVGPRNRLSFRVPGAVLQAMLSKAAGL